MSKNDHLYSYSNAVLTVNKPEIPWTHKLPSPLEPLTMIVVSGYVPCGATGFALNLMASEDIAFHFNPRFDQREVVRNSRHRGHWGREECFPPLLPLRPGENFELVVLTTDLCYKVAMNGRHFVDFTHRLPFNSVTHLNLYGDVHAASVQVFNPGRFHAEHPQGDAVFPGPLMPIDTGYQPLYNPDVPFTYPLQGLSLGTRICLSGHPLPSNFQKFCLDVYCGEDIALHINPRQTQNVVVVNTRLGDHWGPEVKAPLKPHFRAGVYFDLEVKVCSGGFSLAVCGSPLVELFPHRVLPLSRITALRVEGDVVVSGLALVH